MNKINIYLIAEEAELGDDKLELGNFIRNLNDKYNESCNVYFKLINDEKFQELSEDEIKNSELFYILFCNKMDDKKMQKFKIAYNNFMEKNSPKVSTYAKKTDKPIKEMRNLLKDFEEEFGHYHSNYENVDTVKLNFILKLQNFGLPLGNIETKDGKIFLDNDEVMTLDNIPMIFNNKDLQNLKTEIKQLDEEYWKLKNQMLTDDSEELLDSYIEVAERRKKVKEDIDELEKNIINLESSIVKMSSEGKLSPKQIYAKNCLEDGDVKSALEALDLKEIVDEADKTLELQKDMDDVLRVSINEILQKTEVLEKDIDNDERFEEIDKLYKEAIELEKMGNLPKEALEKYCIYLEENERTEEAKKYREMLQNFRELED